MVIPYDPPWKFVGLFLAVRMRLFRRLLWGNSRWWLLWIWIFTGSYFRERQFLVYRLARCRCCSKIWIFFWGFELSTVFIDDRWWCRTLRSRCPILPHISFDCHCLSKLNACILNQTQFLRRLSGSFLRLVVNFFYDFFLGTAARILGLICLLREKILLQATIIFFIYTLILFFIFIRSLWSSKKCFKFINKVSIDRFDRWWTAIYISLHLLVCLRNWWRFILTLFHLQ